jgi:hypothetical protein
MNYLAWMIRAKRWAQRPPSEKRVKFIFGVVALCLMIAGYEWIFGWPDWLSVNRLSMKP